MTYKLVALSLLISCVGVTEAMNDQPEKGINMTFSVKTKNDDGSYRADEEIKKDMHNAFKESFKKAFGWAPEEDNDDVSSKFSYVFIPIAPVNPPKLSLEQLLFFYKAAKQLEKKNQK